LVLRRDHLDLVAELLAEHLEGGLVQRLGGRGHLAEVEEERHERARLHGVAGQRLDLVGEIGDRCAAAHADRLPVAAGDVDATYDRGIPHLEFLPLRPTRLALLGLAAALAEGAGRAAAGTTTATATAGATGEATTRAREATATTGTTRTARTLLERRTGTTAATPAAGAWGARARGAGARCLGTRNVAGVGTLAHALLRREWVVARTRTGGAL